MASAIPSTLPNGQRKPAHNFKDIIGETFTRWTVLHYVGSRKAGNGKVAIYRCRCECLTEKDVVGATLRNGTSKSCGCLKLEDFLASGHAQAKDLKDRTFGLLTVVSRVPREQQKTRRAEWLCQCECRRSAVVRGSDLISGNTTSCGCVSGKWKTPEEVAQRKRVNATRGAARRRAAERQAFKPANIEAFLLLEAELYERAKRLTEETGIKWSVDHIVPIVGPKSKELGCRIVCGLHNEHNLQVMPMPENRAKSNTWWPDMPGGS